MVISRRRSGFSGERSIVLPKIIIEMMENDPVVSALHITDIGYYPEAKHHYRERSQPISEYVFIYCINGCGYFRVYGRQYRVVANQYFILPAGVPHEYASDEDTPWTIYWIHFSGTLAKYYAEDALTPQSINPGVQSRISVRTNLFEEIFNSLQNGYSIENIRFAMSMFHHYLGTLRYLHQYREVGDKIDESNIVECVIHFMEENIEKHLSLQEVADYSGFSASHLSMLFKKKTGHSPLNYFNIMKVKHACELLDNTSMKLNQICYKIGVTDPYYFSRMFTKIMGISPKAYREQEKA